MAVNSDLVGYRFIKHEEVDLRKDDIADLKLQFTNDYKEPVPVDNFKALLQDVDSRNGNIILRVNNPERGLSGIYHIKKLYENDVAKFRTNEPGAPQLDGGKRKMRRVTKRARKHRRSSRRN